MKNDQTARWKPRPPFTAVNALKLVLPLVAILLGCACQGTLIVSVPTKDGMLIVSDKLETITGRGRANRHVDGLEKVLLLSSTAAVGFTGLIGLHEGDESDTNLPTEPLFAAEFAKYYFITNHVEDFDGQQFANCMGAQVSNYIGHLALQFDASEGPGCEFLVFRTTPDRRRRTLAAFIAFGQSGTNLTVTSTQCKEYVQKDGDPAEILAFGQPFVPLELKQGNDPRFDDLRGNWMINKFLPRPPMIRNAELADAELFARCLMEAAGEKSILLNTNAAIGTTMDETILEF